VATLITTVQQIMRILKAAETVAMKAVYGLVTGK
jgi:hypothetical protein